MTNRFNADPKSKFGVAPVPTGFGAKAFPTDFYLPAAGLEDVDRALFQFFDKELNLQVTDRDKKQKKVPVFFSGGEKWAMVKTRRGVRDRNGNLILPIMTIARSDILQDQANDITGRGMNQQTGEITIRRRLSKTSDRNYQSLVNRMLIPNQKNLAIDSTKEEIATQPGVDRVVGDLLTDGTITEGGLLLDDKQNNVYETIVIPAPQFFTATYTITIWVQYLQHMNQVLEHLISSFLQQGNCWRLDTDKGYWYVAHVDGGTFTSKNNFDDMSQEERLIRKEFTIKVPAFLLASDAPGTPVPVRRYVSVPDIKFVVDVPVETTEIASIDDPFLGADDPTLPLADGKTWRRDQRDDTSTRLYPRNNTVATPSDPALRGRQPAKYKVITGIDALGNTVKRYAKVKSVNASTGETIFYPNTDLGGLKIISIED